MLQDDETKPPWPEILLAVAIAVLVLEIFPGGWWWVVAVVDVRGWTWRSYASASAALVIVLVVLKAWIERDT